MPITIDGAGTLTGLSAGGLPDSSITTADIAASAVTPAKLSQPLTLETAKASTSGTEVLFTGIPSWVKRVTLMFVGVSTNGTSNLLIQLGSGGVVQTSGYLGSTINTSNAAVSAVNNYTAGIGINGAGAANVYHGALIISLVTGNTYAAFGSLGYSSSANFISMASSVALSGTLDRVRVTTVNGTDTFDAGTINIMYEG